MSTPTFRQPAIYDSILVDLPDENAPGGTIQATAYYTYRPAIPGHGQEPDRPAEVEVENIGIGPADQGCDLDFSDLPHQLQEKIIREIHQNEQP